MSTLTIAGREFSSTFLGTGKFPSNESMRDALAASGTQIVTVALRRADLSGKKDPFANILEFIDSVKYLFLPNTSGALNAEEAVRLARLAAAAGLPKWVKLEIHPDPRYLLPDPIETLKAAEILVKEGFTVLPYINADPVLAKRLQEAGTRDRDAPGRAHRLEPRAPHPRPDRIIIEQAHGARGGGCRTRRAHPRRRGHGTGRGRRAGQHRHRHRRRSGAHGHRLQAGGRSRPRRL